MSQPSAPPAPAPNKVFQDLAAYVTSLEEMKKSMTSELDVLRAKLGTCEKEKAAVLEQFKAISQIQENATKDAQKAKQELEKVKIEMKFMKDIRAEYDSAAKTIIALNDQVETSKRKFAQVEKQLLEALKARDDAMKARDDAMKARDDAMKAKSDAAAKPGPILEKKQNNAANMDITEEVALKMATLESENEDLKRQLMLMQQLVDSQNAEFQKKYGARCNEFETYKTTSISDMNKLRAENTELQMKVLELEERKHDLTKSTLGQSTLGQSTLGQSSLKDFILIQPPESSWKQYMIDLGATSKRFEKSAAILETYTNRVSSLEEFLTSVMKTEERKTDPKKINDSIIDKTGPTIFDQLVCALGSKVIETVPRRLTPEGMVASRPASKNVGPEQSVAAPTEEGNGEYVTINAETSQKQ